MSERKTLLPILPVAELNGKMKKKELKKIRGELISEMKSVFGTDDKRISHALAVLDFAEQIYCTEGGDELVVTAAAVLHDIGIHQAEQKHNSAAGNYQEIEGPPIARSILEKYGVEHEQIEHICKIIANHHSSKDIDTGEFRILWDADWLVNLKEFAANSDRLKLSGMIDRVFKTGRGQKIAIEIYGIKICNKS